MTAASSSEPQTFIIAVNGVWSDSLRVYMKQCTYEELYKLPHLTEYVSAWLLAPEPNQQPYSYGTLLVNVETLHPVHLAQVHAQRAAWALRQLPKTQRQAELAAVMSTLQAELLSVKLPTEI